MSIGLAYYIILLVWLILGIWQQGPFTLKGSSGSLILFILLLLVGWRVFGPPIHS